MGAEFEKQVSVIMGVYNQWNREALQKAVKSILNQTLTDFEFIIYDDGSDPEVAGYIRELEKLDERIVLIGKEENHGLAFSLNMCIGAAKGKYIARMDADDIALPERLQVQYDFMEQHKEYAWCGCNTRLFDENGVWGERKMPEFLVMTSGNISGAPICRDDREAEAELSGFCDCMLSHDRKIRIRADDSVMDFYENKPYMIRRSRGYAPLPFMVSTPYRGQVLAIGGELKNSFCIGVDNRFYPSPYVGDLEDLRTVKALRETVGRMETLLEVEPEIVCCDMHPKYNSVMVAEELGLPVVKVQHHYAHILSCMAENDCAEQVIGVSFDGTGYGTDGTIWGGEILLSDLDGFTRVGSVMPFLQVGGDASSKEGWRIAVSLIYGMTGDRKKAAEITEKLELCTKQEANVQFTMADRKINAVISTSAGRLFDGVSAMLGIRRKSTFEGEASMALEFAAEEYRETMLEKSKQQIQETEKYGYDKEDTDTLSRNENLSETEEIKRMDDKLISAGDRLLLNTESLIKEILNCQLNGEDPGKLAYFFHRELACQITAACVKIRELSGCNKAALSGGVFQNRLLLELTDHMLLEQGFEVLKHQLLPPNDGGIALGQAVYAMAYLEKSIETKTI